MDLLVREGTTRWKPLSVCTLHRYNGVYFKTTAHRPVIDTNPHTAQESVTCVTCSRCNPACPVWYMQTASWNKYCAFPSCSDVIQRQIIQHPLGNKTAALNKVNMQQKTRVRSALTETHSTMKQLRRYVQM